MIDRAQIVEQDSSYRRGLLLGLTMAEIMILIVFILMLAMGLLLHLEKKDRKDFEALTVIQRDQITNLNAAAQSAKSRYQALQNEASGHRKQLKRLQEAAAAVGVEPTPKAIRRALGDLSNYQKLSDNWRELVDAAKSAGISQTSDAMAKAIRMAPDTKALGDRSASEIVKENNALKQSLAELREIKNPLSDQPPIILLREADGYFSLPDLPSCRHDFLIF